ncbi:MAG TPA: hypothetical protein VHJ78_04745 [Actinomycetota bacterium]|nr:hypothetical protein [Actinomycetota bacterium]
MTETAEARFGSGRRAGIRIAAILSLLLLSFFFGLVALEAAGVVESGGRGSPDDPPPSREALLGAAMPGETVHVAGAAAVVVLVASGLISLAVRPEGSASAQHVLAVSVGLILTLPLVGNPDNRGGQAGWFDPLFLLVALPGVGAALLARPFRHLRSGENGPRLGFVALAAAALPAAWYGVGQALLQRNTFPPTADPHHNAHWWAMSVFAFGLVLVVAAASLPSVGWRLGPAVAALGAIAVGVASLLSPSSASAIGAGWAVAAVLWGVAVIALTSRRPPAQRPSSA